MIVARVKPTSLGTVNVCPTATLTHQGGATSAPGQSLVQRSRSGRAGGLGQPRRHQPRGLLGGHGDQQFPVSGGARGAWGKG
jgi:hypothetical protein